MSKRIITVVEDVDEIRNELKASIEHALNYTVEVKTFATNTDFEQYQASDEFSQSVRASIFDLANNKNEANPGQSFSIKEYIEKNYYNFRVPIFIHSAYLRKLPEFNDLGTIFKIAKSPESIDRICELLVLMNDTGFLDVFSPNGELEKRHPQDLHEVFTSQFRKNGAELEEILNLLKTCHQDADKCKERVNAVFQRMALRALVNKLNSRAMTDNGPDSTRVNILEHFYRRTNIDVAPIWTGDILENTADGTRVYVMKPKCDLERVNPTEDAGINVLVCPVIPKKFPTYSSSAGEKKQKGEREAIDSAAKHNPFLGIKTRIIPPSIFYPNEGSYPEGSAVDLTDPMTLKYGTLAQEYRYLVTLSDDFINEIATRFSSYLVRPGIVEIDPNELAAQVAI
jgi:hypothetical protein